MRTFDRDTYVRAEQLWQEGRFDWRWRTVRRIAAERGFILPPNGSVHDDRDASPPSQRAIIYGALEANPGKTELIVRRSRSWGEVVDGVIGMEARLADEADERQRDDAWSRRDEPTGREATFALKAVLDRVRDSS